MDIFDVFAKIEEVDEEVTEMKEDTNEEVNEEVINKVDEVVKEIENEDLTEENETNIEEVEEVKETEEEVKEVKETEEVNTDTTEKDEKEVKEENIISMNNVNPIDTNPFIEPVEELEEEEENVQRTLFGFTTDNDDLEEIVSSNRELESVKLLTEDETTDNETTEVVEEIKEDKEEKTTEEDVEENKEDTKEDKEEKEDKTTEEDIVEVIEEKEEVSLEDKFNLLAVYNEEINKDNISYKLLNKLLVDDLKEILDTFEVKYPSNAVKRELINFLLEDLGYESLIVTEEEEENKDKVKELIENKTKTKAVSINDIEVNIPVTDMTYLEAVEALKPSFIDEEWNNYKVDIDERLGSIVIEDDMNPGTLKLTISELSKLRQEIWYNYQQMKTLYETLGSKEPEGLIERIKKMAFNPNDRNDMERKRTQIEACINFKDPVSGRNINLLEMFDETRERYNFLKSVMDSLQYKTNALITMNGALKLEKSHIE